MSWNNGPYPSAGPVQFSSTSSSSSPNQSNPCASLCFGFVILAFSIWLIFWNEGGAVQVAQSLDEGLSKVVSLPTPPDTHTSSKHEGQLVHVTGQLEVGEVHDDTFGIRVKALRLKRRVRMFQCIETREDRKQETRDQFGNTRTETITEYRYSGQWSESLHNVRNYRYPERCGMPGDPASPTSFPFPSLEFVSPTVQVGAFEVSPYLHSQIHASQQLDLQSPKLIGFEDANTGKSREVALARVIPSGCEVSGSEIRMVKHIPNGPHLGDAVITFDVTFPQIYSMVAQVTDGVLVPYRASAGRDIGLIQPGTMSAEEMFTQAQDQNRMMTWVVRAAASFLVFVGFRLILDPIPMLLSLVPLVGPLAGAVASFGVSLVAFILAVVVSATAISLAWFAARPILSATVIIGCAIVSTFLFFQKKPTTRRFE